MDNISSLQTIMCSESRSLQVWTDIHWCGIWLNKSNTGLVSTTLTHWVFSLYGCSWCSMWDCLYNLPSYPSVNLHITVTFPVHVLFDYCLDKGRAMSNFMLSTIFISCYYLSAQPIGESVKEFCCFCMLPHSKCCRKCLAIFSLEVVPFGCWNVQCFSVFAACFWVGFTLNSLLFMLLSPRWEFLADGGLQMNCNDDSSHGTQWHIAYLSVKVKQQSPLTADNLWLANQHMVVMPFSKEDWGCVSNQWWY